MLHVLWFVHAYGKFDLELIWTSFGDAHLMELALFGAVGSRMKDDLNTSTQQGCELQFFVANHVKHTNLWPTLPSSLSSSARTPVLSVKSFTFTAGNGWVVVKSPWVPQLHRNETENTWLCVCQLTALCTKPQLHFNCKNTYMSSKYNHLTRGVPQSSVLGHQSVSLTNTRIHTPKEEHYTTRGNKEVSKLPKDTDICLGLVRNWTL